MRDAVQHEYLRAERLIAGGRVILALFALTVLRLDPELAGRSSLLYLVEGGFLVYSVTFVLLARRAAFYSRRVSAVLHLVDFLFFSLMILLTHASVSPFFIFFLFSLVTGLLRFGVSGMLATSAWATFVYVAMALADPAIRADPGYLIMRTSSLGVATLFLARLGAHHARVRAELTQLANWPRSASSDRETIIREVVSSAHALMSARETLMAWEEEEEPWVTTVRFDGAGMSTARKAPGFLDKLVPEDLRDLSFMARRAGDHVELVTFRSGRIVRLSSWPLGEEFDGGRQVESVVTAPVHGRTVSGRIFILDAPASQLEDVSVADVAARLVGAALDQLNSALRSREAAVAGERLRVGRDLHDGVLQSLTGIALQLELARQMVSTDPQGAAAKLNSLQELIAENQQELRGMIRQLRPELDPVVPRLDVRLRELARRFERQWDIRVEMAVHAGTAALPDLLATELYSIVSEAVANAARHASASRLQVSVRVLDTHVAISVADDGRGFPFLGTFTLAELDEARQGPVTLKERVASLGGDLLLSSSESGATIEMNIPLGGRPETLS